MKRLSNAFEKVAPLILLMPVLWLVLVFLALHGYIAFEAFGMYSTAGNSFYDAWNISTILNYWF